MVDFNKLLGEEPQSNETDPLLIFERLDKESGKEYLRPPQKTVLSEWNNKFRNQKDTIVKLERDIEENKKKGEIIFERYQDVKELLTQFNIDRKNMSWDEVKEKYKNHALLKQINEKQGLITLEL